MGTEISVFQTEVSACVHKLSQNVKKCNLPIGEMSLCSQTCEHLSNNSMTGRHGMTRPKS